MTEELKQETAEVTGQPDTIRTRVKKTDAMKFIGLVVFLVLCGVAVMLLWPYIGLVFQDGGVEILRERINDAGIGGVFIILAIQLLQIIVAVIPGEVVQVAAGAIYGTWLGFAIIVVGCMLSSTVVFLLVRKLGAPFVQEMVSTKYMDKFRNFEKTGKLDIIVFILFLIPGLPKDVFTYLVPLTDMKLGRFLLLTTLGRMPGMFFSVFAANGLMQGNYKMALIIFGVAAVIAVLGIVYRDRIMAFLSERRDPNKAE